MARFPDLYGPWVESICQRRIFPQVIKGEIVGWPGDLEAPREFIYVEDAAEAMVRLAESETGWGKAWHVPGPETTTAQKFIETAFFAAGHEAQVKSIGWASMAVGGLVKRDTKEEMELYYLFEKPPLLDGSRWKGSFGPHPTRPYERGIRRTVEWWRAREGVQ